MATYKQIGDGIITQIVALSAFVAARVQRFGGSIDDFFEEETYNLPFAGVCLESADCDEYTSDNLSCREHLTYRVLVVSEDFRGRKYARQDAYTLIEAIRGTLLGDSLSLSGVEPLQLESVKREEDLPEQGVVAYSMYFHTSQAR